MMEKLADLEKTLQYQDSLPSLPEPDLEITLKKYLESVKPFVSGSEYQKTSQIVKEFGTGVGKKLHEILLEKIKGQRNWLEKLWEDKGYLEGRYPVNPFVNITGTGNYVRKIWPPAEGTQVERAAILLHTFMHFWTLIRRQNLRIDKAGKTPLCMNQYMRVLNACKTPGLTKDRLNFHFKTEEEGPCPTHVVVLCRGRIFSVNGHSANNEILTPPEIQKQLQYIRDTCDKEPEGPGLSALTCADRTTWAKMYNHLEELHPDNRRYLKLIETAIYVMALDDTRPSPVNTDQLMDIGLLGDARSRWADKLTEVIYPNGTVTYNSDHAPFDGLICIYILHFNNQSLEELGGMWKGSMEIRNYEEPLELKFHVDETVRDAAIQAYQTHQQNCSMIEFHHLSFENFGKELMKKTKLHPDTFCQLALQLAYYRLHKKSPPTYETASLRQYWHGRTETVRVCTTAMVEWTKAMMDDSATVRQKLEKLKAAYTKHMSNMVDSSNFEGCDRHLLALSITAEEQGLEVPAIFTDPAYQLSGSGGNFILSTSFVGFTEATGGCSAMCENGYGVFYSIEDNRVKFNMARYKTGDTDCYKLFENIGKSLDDIAILLQSLGQNKPSQDSRL